MVGFALRLAAYLQAGWEPHVWTYPDGLCRWDCQWYVNLAKAGYDTFPVPEGVIPPGAARIMDLQSPDKKMSKSLPPSGCVNLLDDPAVTAKKIRSAVTDTGREVVADPETKPGITNLLTIHSALSGTSIDDLEQHFADRGYGDLKKELADVVAEFVTPVRRRTLELLGDRAELERILAAGATRAREVAAVTLAEAYDRVGFLPPARGASA